MANPNTDLQRPTKSPSRPYYTLASERTPMALKTTANLFFLSLSIYCQRTASTRAEHTITTNHISTYHFHGRSSPSSSASTHASKDTRTPSTALLFFRLILGRQSFFDFSSLIFHYSLFLFCSPSIRVELHFIQIPHPFSFFRCIHRGLQGGKFKVWFVSFLL
jgi:hypothetical protein